VATGIAVPAGDRGAPIADTDQLRSCLSVASALYCLDTERSTAGIHFAGVLRTLRIYDDVASRLRAYADGAEAMAAMAAAASAGAGAVGCTQVTEILYTQGVSLVGLLPPPFELTTVYSVAVARGARAQIAAQRFAARLAGPQSLELRRASGFG
jgi:molybdate transport system substrate-binding protein